MTDRKKPGVAFWATVVVVVVLVAYLGSYFALLDRKVYWPAGVDPVTRQNIFKTRPRYLIDGELVERMLDPVHRLDRILRKEYWETIEKTNGGKWKNPPGSLPRL